ncbi:hypothetical protein BMR1_03g03900 [Babesia microti strain RI]|uniref:C3H1-type domain-containing protein n=1 Tax=Babesia microti (strain RI) TaxID=1133968 RepID=A0A0K3ASC6_BABMR|nr:hypothetical protein BMR1_03g03900 [Babesia microti strain RI]CTQ41380.1 hypothetical protein BMR1_03g03900 [Babesia microti strain RI]|eukprot:XP_012649391.1 hypothetical protein BMR1_03g03900 [Babesia microti strain RI]
MPMLSEDDLVRFRTKICKLASTDRCEFGDERCSYSHNIYWGRRCPYYLRDMRALRYLPEFCPDSTMSSNQAIIENCCTRGNNCAFAHSQEEINYHPLVYKTVVCNDYKEGKCKKYYCPKIHGLAERRLPSKFYMTKRKGIIVTHYPNVMFIDKIRKSKELQLLDNEVVPNYNDYNSNSNGSISNNIKSKTLDLIKSYDQCSYYSIHNNEAPHKSLGLESNVDYEIERVLAGFTETDGLYSPKLQSKPTICETERFINNNSITYRTDANWYEDNLDKLMTIGNLNTVAGKVEVLKRLGIFNSYEDECEYLNFEQYIKKVMKLCDLIKSLAVTSATYSTISSFDNDKLIDHILSLLHLLVTRHR